MPAENEIKYLQRENVGVSYHYYVTKEGVVHQFVPLIARAWHAGSSAWGADVDLNDLSVGVALESTNGFAEVYPPDQWDAAHELTLDLMERFGISSTGVLSHKEVSVPQGRKIDPVAFPLDQFRASIAGKQIKVPLLGERNEKLGTVTIVDGRKAYLPDAVRAALCS